MAAAVMTACVKERIETETVLKKGQYIYSVKASISSDDATRTDYDENGKFSWTAGDQISVLFNNGTDNKFFTLTAEAPGATATFTGTIDAGYTIGALDGTAEDAKIWALYPASENHSYADGTAKFYVQPEVDFTATGFSANIPMYDLLTAKGEFSFKNLASTYVFTLKNLNASINKVKFTVTNQESRYLSGLWPIKLEDKWFLNYGSSSSSSENKTLTYINNVTDGQAVFYVSCRYWGKFQPHITISDAENNVVLKEFVAGHADEPHYTDRVKKIALNMGTTQAVINAVDVIVKKGGTATIGATTNSTATIEYVSGDPGIATVSDNGVVTGISEGTTTITLSVPAVEGSFTEATKIINVTVTTASPTAMAIDGDFSDWATMEPGTFYKAVNNNPDYSGVKEMRVYATEETVFYYIKFDEDRLHDAMTAETPTINMRINLNTDGEFTSGYNNYFLDAYDFIIEGSIVSGGAFKSFSGTLSQRIDNSWASLGSGMTTGAGSGIEYEIALDRAKFNVAANTSSVPMPMGNEFQTGLRFYWNGWNEFSNIPNASGGYGHLLNVQIGGGTDPGDDPIYEYAAPEVKDGDVIISPNADVNQFLTDISYPAHDYSFTSLLSWASNHGVSVCPGESDRPQEYSIRWTPYSSTSDATVTVSEPTRNWVYTASVETGYVNITNLLPNTHYTYRVTADGTTLTQGEFDTVGKVHQLFIRSSIHNCRDLGGWKTTDGKTVKYRKVYRGGRLEPSYLDKEGKAVIKTEGIKAQLDLRGQSDVLSECTLKGIVSDYAFCAPVVEEGYRTMLRDDKEKTRQCIQFIMDCVAQDKPVYFHCSLGRDRTGTVAMLTLGILGVPEGDISQEYELTQFAPHGYATSNGESQKMTRIADWGYGYTADYIWEEYAGNGSFQDGVNAYLLDIGISQADIDRFKNNMLE